MKELDKAQEMGVKGPLRDEALDAFRRQIDAWGLVMPPARTLVSDFGLGDFYRAGLIECWIANEIEAGYCGKFLFLFDGQTCPRHSHRQKMETFFVVKGQVEMTCVGRTSRMSAGDVLRVDPGQRHRFTGLGPALLLEVSKPCRFEDNDFEDPRIPIGGNYRRP